MTVVTACAVAASAAVLLVLVLRRDPEDALILQHRGVLGAAWPTYKGWRWEAQLGVHRRVGRTASLAQARREFKRAAEELAK